MSRRKHGAKIQIMSEDDIGVGTSPFHDFRVGGARVTNAGPMNCRPSAPTQFVDPFDGQIHVNNNSEGHSTTNGSSRSSSLQAA